MSPSVPSRVEGTARRNEARPVKAKRHEATQGRASHICGLWCQGGGARPASKVKSPVGLGSEPFSHVSLVLGILKELLGCFAGMIQLDGFGARDVADHAKLT